MRIWSNQHSHRKDYRLNFSSRQTNGEFSRLSDASRKKLTILKLSLFTGVALFSYWLYYFNLFPAAYHQLLSFFLVMSIACNLIPIPTYAFVLYLSHDYALWIIVLVGSMGATISALIEYNIVDFIMRFDRIARLKDTRKYQKFAVYFDRFSFRSIMIASSIPLPIDFIRIMAITRRYPMGKYLLATMLGRIPRFTAIAFLGSQLPRPKEIAVLLVGLTLAFELVRRLRKFMQRVPAAERGV